MPWPAISPKLQERANICTSLSVFPALHHLQASGRPAPRHRRAHLGHPTPEKKTSASPAPARPSPWPRSSKTCNTPPSSWRTTRLWLPSSITSSKPSSPTTPSSTSSPTTTTTNPKPQDLAPEHELPKRPILRVSESFSKIVYVRIAKLLAQVG